MYTTTTCTCTCVPNRFEKSYFYALKHVNESIRKKKITLIEKVRKIVIPIILMLNISNLFVHCVLICVTTFFY